MASASRPSGTVVRPIDAVVEVIRILLHSHSTSDGQLADPPIAESAAVARNR